MEDHEPTFLSDHAADQWLNSSRITGAEEEDKFKRESKFASSFAKKSYIIDEGDDDNEDASQFSMPRSAHPQPSIRESSEMESHQHDYDEPQVAVVDDEQEPDQQPTESYDEPEPEAPSPITPNAGTTKVTKNTQSFSDGRKIITTVTSTVMSDGSIEEMTEIDEIPAPVVITQEAAMHMHVMSPQAAAAQMQKTPRGAEPDGTFFAKTVKSGCCGMSTERVYVYVAPDGKWYDVYGEPMPAGGILNQLKQGESVHVP